MNGAVERKNNVSLVQSLLVYRSLDYSNLLVERKKRIGSTCPPGAQKKDIATRFQGPLAPANEHGPNMADDCTCRLVCPVSLGHCTPVLIILATTINGQQAGGCATGGGRGGGRGVRVPQSINRAAPDRTGPNLR